MILCGSLVTNIVFAATPNASCPSGWTMYSMDSLVLTDPALAGATSTTGHTLVRTIPVCTSGMGGSGSRDRLCYMYAPASTSYDDTTGTYQYVNICPLT